jgi:hypothetical protein
VIPLGDGIECKFNPYHDPRNGRFTFAPGGPRSLDHPIVSHRRSASRSKPVAAPAPPEARVADDPAGATISDAVYRPARAAAMLQPAGFAPSAEPRGGNIRAFDDPMTLEQVFPDLRDTPGGALVALADDAFDFSGPSRALTAELTKNWSNRLIEQIKAIDPSYHFDSLGFPATQQGKFNQLDGLRFDRAAAFLRMKNELRPLQVETLRFVQEQTDAAYAQGLKLLRAHRLNVRLNEQEALGNYVDREVRRNLREQYNQYGIDSAGKGPVRVNRRENDSSASELTYRRPDARVGKVAFDVTLAEKTAKTAQVRGFFNTDFRPDYVVIIRPRQLGPGSTYIIPRLEK